MTNLLKELEAVVGLADKSTSGTWKMCRDDGKPMLINNVLFGGGGTHGQAADADMILASVNFIRTHHAEIAEAVKNEMARRGGK
jgi:hypothetical protein